MYRFWYPLIAFVIVSGFLWLGLDLKPREIPSVLVDKPAPEFSTKRLLTDNQITSTDLIGKPWVLNVWASWCVACRQEHPLFNDLAKRSEITILGLNYKDKPVEAAEWLQNLGNPYDLIAVDDTGNIGIEYGVYGVPETFLIDHHGMIRYKHIGPVSAQDMEQILLPRIRSMLQDSKT
ncbi:MAG: DsbE family thiol:disulfide interchange protein [Pseudomonadota bacterium]